MTGPNARVADEVGVRVVPISTGFAEQVRRVLVQAEKDLQLDIPVSLNTAWSISQFTRCLSPRNLCSAFLLLRGSRLTHRP